AFAAPTSRTRSPRSGPTYRSSSTWKEWPLAPQLASSQPRSRFTNGSTASTRSSGSYQPSARAFSTQPAVSPSFSRAPGRSSCSSRGIPSSTPKERPQPPQESELSSSRRDARQKGQRRSSRRAVSTSGSQAKLADGGDARPVPKHPL